MPTIKNTSEQPIAFMPGQPTIGAGVSLNVSDETLFLANDVAYFRRQVADGTLVISPNSPQNGAETGAKDPGTLHSRDEASAPPAPNLGRVSGVSEADGEVKAAKSAKKRLFGRQE